MLYEHRSKRPLTRRAFALRMARHFGFAIVLTLLSLALGMIGYMTLEDLEWRDAFLNSAMLLGGMGPVDPPQTDSGKLFAGLYALYAGLLFLVIASVVMAPVLHRVLHRFHWEQQTKDD